MFCLFAFWVARDKTSHRYDKAIGKDIVLPLINFHLGHYLKLWNSQPTYNAMYNYMYTRWLHYHNHKFKFHLIIT